MAVTWRAGIAAAWAAAACVLSCSALSAAHGDSSSDKTKRAASGHHEKESPVTDEPAPVLADADRSPFVEIQAAPRYFIGLPIVISVTWDNRSPEAEFLRMPPLNLLFMQGGRIHVELVPTGPEGAALETGFSAGEEGSPVVALGKLEKRQMVCDLANTGDHFEPGSYDLVLKVNGGGGWRSSNTVHTVLSNLTDRDAAEATRLRRLGDASFDTGAWAPFLTRNMNTVTVAPTLAPAARAQLALHLFLHRAMWTPGPLAKIDPSSLEAIAGANVDGEVAVLKYELAHARKDPAAATARHELLARFPGLGHRLTEIDHGKGTLARYRELDGVEQTFEHPPAHWPYRPKRAGARANAVH
jgi:hypothetical protein